MRISDWSSDVCSSDLFDGAAFAVQWAAGTRRIARLDTDLGGGRSLTLIPSGPVFAMSGLGSTHPIWGHGLDHGPGLAFAPEPLSEADPGRTDELRVGQECFGRVGSRGYT